jgi:hypothetical protein
MWSRGGLIVPPAIISDYLSEAEVKRARMQCHIAGAVFAACAAGGALAPLAILPAVRWVFAVFNVVTALAAVLYARSIR